MQDQEAQELMKKQSGFLRGHMPLVNASAQPPLPRAAPRESFDEVTTIFFH